MARVVFLAVALLVGSAVAQTSCPSTTSCGGAGVCDSSICPNCQLISTCTPNAPGTCPASPIPGGQQCSFASVGDGCGGTNPAYTCNCATGFHCDSATKTCVPDCPPSCTVTVTSNNGVTTTLGGVCALSQPTNTVPGGQGDCPTSCGKCYVSSYNPALCNTQANSACATSGACGCFTTLSGATCQAGNFAAPLPVPIPGNGGGCSENLCNALAQKSSLSAACCPQGCK